MASWEKRTENSYRIVVFGGYDLSGKVIQQRKTVKLPNASMTEKQREKWLNEQCVLFENEVNSGNFLEGGNITFGKYADWWYKEYALKNLAESTHSNIRIRLYERIIPALGHKKLTDIKPSHIMQLYNNLLEAGIRKDIKYSPTTKMLDILSKEVPSALSKEVGVSPKTALALAKGGNVGKETADKFSRFFKHKIEELFTPNEKNKLSTKTAHCHINIVSQVMGIAVDDGLIASNPVSKARIPALEKKEAEFYDDGQLLELLSLLENQPLKYKAAMYLEIDTGIRVGELSGLKWSDIDFEKRVLSIRRQKQYIHQQGVKEKEKTKSVNGLRDISLSKTLIKILLDYYEEQEANRKKLENMYVESDCVFVHEDGEPMHPHRFYTWLTDFLDKNNLKHITFHQLRHSNLGSTEHPTTPEYTSKTKQFMV